MFRQRRGTIALVLIASLYLVRAVPLWAVPPAGDSDGRTREGVLYEAPDESFVVWLPEDATASEKDGVKLYQASLDELHFQVVETLNPLVADESYEEQHERFHQARDLIAKAVGGKLVEDFDIRYENRAEGCLLRFFSSESEVYRIRIYCVGDYFFQLWVGGRLDDVDGEAANRFFQSFHVN